MDENTKSQIEKLLFTYTTASCVILEEEKIISLGNGAVSYIDFQKPFFENLEHIGGDFGLDEYVYLLNDKEITIEEVYKPIKIQIQNTDVIIIFQEVNDINNIEFVNPNNVDIDSLIVKYDKRNKDKEKRFKSLNTLFTINFKNVNNLNLYNFNKIDFEGINFTPHKISLYNDQSNISSVTISNIPFDTLHFINNDNSNININIENSELQSLIYSTEYEPESIIPLLSVSSDTTFDISYGEGIVLFNSLYWFSNTFKNDYDRYLKYSITKNDIILFLKQNRKYKKSELLLIQEGVQTHNCKVFTLGKTIDDITKLFKNIKDIENEFELKCLGIDFV